MGRSATEQILDGHEAMIQRLQQQVSDLNARLDRYLRRPTTTTDYRMGEEPKFKPLEAGEWVWVPKPKTYRHYFHVDLPAKTWPLPPGYRDGMLLLGKPIVWDNVEEL